MSSKAVMSHPPPSAQKKQTPRKEESLSRKVVVDALYRQKAPYIWAWGHFALPKSPLYMEPRAGGARGGGAALTAREQMLIPVSVVSRPAADR